MQYDYLAEALELAKTKPRKKRVLATVKYNWDGIKNGVIYYIVLAEPYSPEANGIACPETARYNDRSIRKERTPC